MTKKFKALWVEEEIFEKVKAQAEKENLKMSTLIRIIINSYLVANSDEKK